MSEGGSPGHPLDRRGSGPAERTLREEARLFAHEHHLASRTHELDRRPEFPWKEAKALAGRGWLGPRVPAALGGAGKSLLEEAALLEELAYAGGSVFAKLVLQPEFASPLQHASPKLQEMWYRPLLKGEALVGNQITEPGAGSDAARLAARADRDGEFFVISGTKSEIAFAEDAGAAIVYARTSPGEGARGISALLVPQDLRGISVERFDDLGERWMRRGSVHYEHVRVPKDHLIGEEGKGFRYLLEELTPERALLSVLYLSLARASWEETRRHVLQRKAFDRPLGSFEGVSFPLAEDLAELESARLYAFDVLSRLDVGERADGPAALSKALGNDVALRVLDHAMRFHGGAGYSTRLPHEQRWRDVRSGTIAHGSREVLLMVAARELIGRETLPYGPGSG